MPVDKEEQMRTEAAEILQDKIEENTTFNQEIEDQVPKLDPEEYSEGDFLGEGGFCTVVEVSEVRLFNEQLDDTKNKKNANFSFHTLQDRNFIEKNFLRHGQARYAIKKISNDLKKKSEAHFVAGIVDLAMEVKYLAVIQHPHVIKMRAVSSSHPCSDSYFVVLDKLYDTLGDRIDVWRKAKKMMFASSKKEDLLTKKLVIAYDICSALSFLHNNRIIYRDLKPENLGFDIRDDVKIFDFGLAREMQEADRFRNTNTFNLTADAGSPRFMAPEVAIGQPYNHKADVYSFSLLLWQILCHKTPFAEHDLVTMNEQVYRADERPVVNLKWSFGLRDLMKDCWSRNINERPDCSEIMGVLRTEISKVSGDAVAATLDISGRTAYSIEAASN